MNFSHLDVIDFHAHFPIVNTTGQAVDAKHPLLAEYARNRNARMDKEWSRDPSEPMPDTEHEVDRALERWVGEAERYGLRRVNFLTAQTNDTLARLVAKYPERFTGFAHHGLEPGAETELKRAVDELGLRGYKLFGPLTAYAFEDPRLRPVWEFCAERTLPVLIHFGYLGRGGGVVHHPRMSPLSLFEVARSFPDIPFVIPHFGAGYWQDLLALCWSLPNIYVDSSGSNQWVRWMPYPLTLEDLFRKAYETIGPERMIFGSDSAGFPRGFAVRYLEDQLRACYSLNFKEEDIRMIFGGNAAALLKLG
ncbi:MAG: amidohydrolase family protein [Trueperaceae bacterium]|nr:amidohydrolase family protein [Trueperaceae bacterium]